MDELVLALIRRLEDPAYVPAAADYEVVRLCGDDAVEGRAMLQRVIAAAGQESVIGRVALAYLHRDPDILPGDAEVAAETLASVKAARNDINVQCFYNRPFALVDELLEHPMVFIDSLRRNTHESEEIRTALALDFGRHLNEHYQRDRLVATVLALCIRHEQTERRLRRQLEDIVPKIDTIRCALWDIEGSIQDENDY